MELIAQGIQTTLIITSVALIAGLLIGITLAIVRTMQIPVLDQLAKVYINLFRSLPLVIVLLGFYLVAPQVIRSTLGISGDIRLACALVAFSVFEGAYFAEILRAGINAIPKNQLQACKAIGFTTLQSYRHVLIPQAIKNSTPVLMTQSIVLFQDTALVYIIGLHDFFGSAVQIGEMNGRSTQMILAASIAYMAICIVTQRIANKITTKEIA